jgi:hypothetical protein
MLTKYQSFLIITESHDTRSGPAAAVSGPAVCSDLRMAYLLQYLPPDVVNVYVGAGEIILAAVHIYSAAVISDYGQAHHFFGIR